MSASSENSETASLPEFFAIAVAAEDEDSPINLLTALLSKTLAVNNVTPAATKPACVPIESACSLVKPLAIAAS